MARVTVAEAAAATAPAARFPAAIWGVRLDRRRFAVWLVAIASFLTLGHLLGPQGDLHSIAPRDHDVEHDHADEPSHDHGDHACGLAMLPDTTAAAPPAAATEAVDARCAGPIAVPAAVDVRDRSPTDLVSELQVNRV